MLWECAHRSARLDVGGGIVGSDWRFEYNIFISFTEADAVKAWGRRHLARLIISYLNVFIPSTSPARIFLYAAWVWDIGNHASELPDHSCSGRLFLDIL